MTATPATRPGVSISVALANHSRMFESVGFSVSQEDRSEEQVAQRYHHPETDWLGQRRDITRVELTGWPGSPRTTDSVRIERWNTNGVGRETLLAFDDLDPFEEIAWNVKGDTERRVYWDRSYCTVHNQHFEDPEHQGLPRRCAERPATLAENLRMLAALAAAHKQRNP